MIPSNYKTTNGKPPHIFGVIKMENQRHELNEEGNKKDSQRALQQEQQAQNSSIGQSKHLQGLGVTKQVQGSRLNLLNNSF